jgi:hypothetical protein
MSSAAMLRVDIDFGTESVSRFFEVGQCRVPLQFLADDAPSHPILRRGVGFGSESE